MFISNRFPSALHAWSKRQRIAVSADVRSPEDSLVEEFPDQKKKKNKKKEEKKRTEYIFNHQKP